MDGLTRIYARNCTVRRIDRSTAKPFLDANHRMGHTYSRRYYGLFVARTGRATRDGMPVEGPAIGTLVAVGGFSGPRRWKTGDRVIQSAEWVRYASLSGLAVDGGMGKVLAAFIAETDPDDIMSYADAAWSNGEVYRKLGFREIETKTFADGAKSIKFRLKLKEYTDDNAETTTV